MLKYEHYQLCLSAQSVKHHESYYYWAYKPARSLNNVSYFHRYRRDDFVVIDTIVDAIYIAVKDNTVTCDLTPKYHEIL